MQLYLQFGFGMMDHCRSLIRSWRGGTAILSPRDLSTEQLARLGKELAEMGGGILLDPQLYKPDANHERLTSHAYWPAESRGPEFWSSSELQESLAELISLNRRLSARAIILPGSLATTIDDDWLESQRRVFEELQRQNHSGLEPIATVALGAKALSNDDQVHALLDAIPSWDVSAIYLVCEHPENEYLVSDPNWLANCLDLVAGARLAKKRVIVGYCNHQMLVLATAGANAIASGTWMNVRSFQTSKFSSQEDEEIKQRATWYYAPHLLSEYKVNFLDMAKKHKLLDGLKTPLEYSSTYADDLFTMPQPSLAAFTEQQAFRHYLQCLSVQAMSTTKSSFAATKDAYLAVLDAAEHTLKVLHQKRITGQQRDFMQAIDANRSALSFLEDSRGPVLARSWSTLTA